MDAKRTCPQSILQSMTGPEFHRQTHSLSPPVAVDSYHLGVDSADAKTSVTFGACSVRLRPRGDGPKSSKRSRPGAPKLGTGHAG